MDRPDLPELLETLSALRGIEGLSPEHFKSIVNCENLLVYESITELSDDDYKNIATMMVVHPDYIDQVQFLLMALPPQKEVEVTQSNVKNKWEEAQSNLLMVQNMIAHLTAVYDSQED